MKIFTAIVERDSETNLYVGYVPGFSGAHSQAETLEGASHFLFDREK
jgi:predicted RNase H-like HicB family nuclease